MPILPITTADLKLLLALQATDTVFDTELGGLLTTVQAAIEYTLDPAVLAASTGDAGLGALLKLGAAEMLAGEFLRRQARAPGATDDFHLGPLTVSASRTDNQAQLGERLVLLGAKRLEPFSRAGRRAAFDASAGLPDGSSRAPLLLQANSGIVCALTPSLFGSAFDTGEEFQ